MTKLKVLVMLIATWVAIGSLDVLGQCPNLQFVDMRGVPGYPQTDDLNVCGRADTLSLLIFTDDPGEIAGFEMTVNLVQGMRYAGFEDTHFGGCTDISNSDPDPQAPTFISGGLSCDNLFVANIGVTADCTVDLVGNDYVIEVDYEYTYFPPTGGAIPCIGTYTLENDFNGAMKVPVLNMFTPSPIDANITALGAPFCQNFQISQDGLQAYVDEFEFSVCGVDVGPTSPVSISTLTANGLDLLANANYTAADTSLTVTVDSSYFPNNTSTNPFGTTDQFDTAEKVNFQICYEVANCPEGADIPLSYKAWYGCNDEICQTTAQSSFLKVRPTGSLMPTITASLDNGITICGEDAAVSTVITNPNTDTDQNVYTDLSIGFQACGMEALSITEVEINGVVVPGAFQLIGDDVDIDLSQNTDPNIGLFDYDGDGFYDDLPGASPPLTVVVKFALGCGIGSDGGCPEINCDNVQFYVKGKTNCGNTFQGFPDTDGFNLIYGQLDAGFVGEVGLNTSGSVIGYDFGVYSSAGGPVAQEPEEVTVEFCYDFTQENIADCPSGGETKMLAYLGAKDIIIADLEVVPGSVEFDDGSGYVSVPDSDVSYTITTDATATIEINAGNNNPTLCYKYNLRLDDCHCGPPEYVALDQQIVSVCSDCAPECEIVKGCGSTLLKADPACSPCPCVASYTPLLTERKNLGYTDKTMSTKMTRDDLIAAGGILDLSRFMPGDTLRHQGFWEITDESITVDPMRWIFRFIPGPIGGQVHSGPNQAALPLIWDAGDIRLTEFRIENADGTIHDVDITSLPGCATGGSQTGLNSYDTHFDEVPWGDSHPDDLFESTYACTFNVWEGYNHQLTDMQFLNFDRMQEINADSGLGSFAPRGDGDCLNEFIAAYGITKGSKIYFDFCVPLIKNPLREQAKILGIDIPEQNTAEIKPVFITNPADEIAGNATYAWGSTVVGCPEDAPYSVDCASGVTAETNIILDSCGGTVEHTFAVSELPGTPGNEWFSHEYRPLIQIHDLELPIYAPLAYCANAEVDQNGVITPVTVDSTLNMSCSPVAGYSDALCAVDSGNIGAIVFDLYDQGINGLGIGLDNCDTIKLSYDFCMECPAPLEGLLDYEMKVDWCVNGQPSDCAIDAMVYFNNGTRDAQSFLDEAALAGYAAVDRGNYYNLFNLDTLFCKVDDTQGIVFIDDSGVTPVIPVAATNVDGINLIAAGAPGSSIEVKEIEFCNNDPLDATGFSGYVSLPSSVAFEGVCADAAGATPLVSTLISDDGATKKYQIDFPSNILATGNCVSVFVKTTLLFCPAIGELPPEICVGASSGCSPDAVRAAIGTSGACSASEVCYAYLSGEADLQTEWFGLPTTPPELCETFTLFVRTKNVKDLVLLNLDPNFTLPPGLEYVPGTWEVAYPGGAVGMTGNFGAWTSVPDPDVTTGFTVDWSNESDWSNYTDASGNIVQIDIDGLPGVSTPIADGNNVSFRFEVTTTCDQFLSGSVATTETEASDPCGPNNLTSGAVESTQLIMNNAVPADYAQILTVASPTELYCGGLANTFGLTALNTSQVPTTDSVVTCVYIPTDVLNYVPGSIAFTNGFAPAWTTETPIGNLLEVCVHSPAIAVGGSWSLNFEAEMLETAACGDIEIGADIKSVVEDVACVPGPPSSCDVFVQNSINPGIFVELKGPLETTDIRVSSDCSASEDPVQICYEIDLSNPGPAYNGNVTVDIYDDVTANQAVDSFDGILNTNTHAVSLAIGETTTIAMCLDVAEIQSCPIIIRQTYETTCACNTEDTPFQSLTPTWFADIEECVVLCPGQPIMLETCGNFDLSFDPVGSVTVTDDGAGNLTLDLNDGFGVSSDVTMNLTATVGECEVMDSRSIKSIGDWVPEDLVADICEEDCVDLDLLIPSNLVDGATITWTPALGLTDTTSDTPKACDLTADQVYNVEIAFGDACVFNIDYTVTYNPNSTTTITGEEFCLCQEAGTLTGNSGFASYEWYSIQQGTEIIEFVGTSNVWNGPTEPGDYILKAYLAGAICPHVSNVVTLEGEECVDLELTKTITNIPTPFVLGSQITYEIEVCNIEDEALGLKFGATNVEVSDELPGGVTYVQHTQTTGNYSPTTNQWDITSLPSGTCETLFIDVTVDAYGPIENTAQISGADQEDIDSTPNNDDGDQSEDDEDAAVVEVEVFDLALTKVVSPTQPLPVTIGDDVTYDIEICNQGTVDAYNIEVVDYLPTGMSLNDPTWTMGAGNEAFYNHAGPLAANACVTIPITCIIDLIPASGTFQNTAEISEAEDANGNNPPDIDSTPDDDPSNDGPADDGTTDNSNGDEDDSDPAIISVSCPDPCIDNFGVFTITKN